MRGDGRKQIWEKSGERARGKAGPSKIEMALPPATRVRHLAVVVDLLLFAAAHEFGLRALVVDVGPEVLDVWLWALLGLFDRLVDLLLGALVDLLEAGLVYDAPLEQLRLEALDRVAGRAHAGNLLTCAVCGARIGERVTTVPVGDHLHQQRAMASQGVLRGKRRGPVHSQHVHCIDLDPGNHVAACKVLCVHAAPLRTRAHAVLVVLAHKHARQLPELRHVEGLKDLALVGRTVAVHGEDGILRARVLLRKGDAGADRDLGTDDTIPTKERGREHVHGASLALGDTCLAAKELSNDTLDCAAALNSEGVAAVGGDELVGWLHARLHPDSNGLLPNGQVAEAADELLLVQLVSRHLHAAHLDHLFVQLDEVLLAGLHLKLRHVLLFQFVVLERLWRDGHLECLAGVDVVYRAMRQRGRLGRDLDTAAARREGRCHRACKGGLHDNSTEEGAASVSMFLVLGLPPPLSLSLSVHSPCALLPLRGAASCALRARPSRLVL